MRRGLEQSHRHHVEIRREARTAPEVVQVAAAIDQNDGKAMAHYAQLEKQAASGTVDANAVQECCKAIEKELQAADHAAEQLAKMLKLDSIEQTTSKSDASVSPTPTPVSVAKPIVTAK